MLQVQALYENEPSCGDPPFIYVTYRPHLKHGSFPLIRFIISASLISNATIKLCLGTQRDKVPPSWRPKMSEAHSSFQQS